MPGKAGPGASPEHADALNVSDLLRGFSHDADASGARLTVSDSEGCTVIRIEAMERGSATAIATLRLGNASGKTLQDLLNSPPQGHS